MRSLTFIGAMVVAATALPATASADPVDNPGNATFRFDTDPAPFLWFPSGEEVDSAPDSGGPNRFRAYVEGYNGELTYLTSVMGWHELDLQVSFDPVSLQLRITNVEGHIDCSGPATECEVDWRIRARLAFDDNDDIDSATCITNTFFIYVEGSWGDTVSDAFTVPALSGSGSGACGSWSSTINNFLDLGTSGTTLALYKMSGTNDATGDPLEGS